MDKSKTCSNRKSSINWKKKKIQKSNLLKKTHRLQSGMENKIRKKIKQEKYEINTKSRRVL